MRSAIDVEKYFDEEKKYVLSEGVGKEIEIAAERNPDRN